MKIRRICDGQWIKEATILPGNWHFRMTKNPAEAMEADDAMASTIVDHDFFGNPYIHQFKSGAVNKALGRPQYERVMEYQP
jgi:hypothetical protein